MRIAALLFALLLVPAFGAAPRSLEAGKPVVLQQDQAYFLFRTIVPKGTWDYTPAFVRLLGDGELKAAQNTKERDRDSIPSNVVWLNEADPFSKKGEELTFILPAKPGTYVVGAVGWVGGAYAFLGNCLCLGTVKFEAKPGVITDLGTFTAARDDIPTTIPQLQKYVRATDTIDPVPVITLLQPFADGMSVPAEVSSLPKSAADYRAAGSFPNYFGAIVDRLPPIPGVLDYDKDGRVVDLNAAR